MSDGPAPSVSVCLLNYRGGEYLDGCLDALARLDPAPTEILAVDNASPDGSGELLERRAATWTGPPLELLRSATNRGYAGGHNLSAARARSDFLGFLNVTVTPEPAWLSVVPWMAERPELGFVQPAVFHRSDPTRLESLGSLFRPSGQFSVVGRNHRPRPDPPARPYEGRVFSVLGAIFVVPRALFRELGGFDESMFMYFEETDLCWRGALRGKRSATWFDPARPTRAYHAFHGTHPAGFDSARYFERNRTLALLRNLGTRNLWGVGRNLATVAGESARRPRFFARYLREVAGGLPDSARRRRAVQASRTEADARLFGLPVPPELPRYFAAPPGEDDGVHRRGPETI